MRYMYLLLSLSLLACTAKSGTTTDVKANHSTSPPNLDINKRVEDLKIQLPKISPPIANYVNVTQSGKTLYLAGKGPKTLDGTYIKGKLGQDLFTDDGYKAARIVGIMQLAVLKDYLGDLNKVKRILKVQGMVNATPDFTNHPEVINGFSDLMVEVFGERGKHARAAVGMASLPRNICVEIDLIVEIY